MKTNLLKLACGLALFSTSHLLPAQSLVFSGTPGSTPVSVAFSSSLNFTITNAASSGEFILFTIVNLFPTNDGEQHIITSFDSNLQYDINGGSLQNVAGWVDDGYTSGAVSGDDGYFFVTLTQDLNPGDVITLNAGTLTSSGDAAADFNLGTSGDYEMFIADANLGDGGLDISDFAIAATPEPSTLALSALGGLLLYRRKNKHFG